MKGYTLEQAERFIEADERRRLRARADRIEETAVGAQQTGKVISKTLKELRSDGRNRPVRK